MRDKTILIDAPKTGTSRSVTKLGPLAYDLSVWQQACPTELLFTAKNGKQMSEEGYSNWRNRVWHPVAPDGVRPYDLRHTCISLLIREKSIAEIAREAGTSIRMIDQHYGHVIEELAGLGGAEEEIRKARAEVHGNLRLVESA